MLWAAGVAGVEHVPAAADEPEIAVAASDDGAPAAGIAMRCVPRLHRTALIAMREHVRAGDVAAAGTAAAAVLLLAPGCYSAWAQRKRAALAAIAVIDCPRGAADGTNVGGAPTVARVLAGEARLADAALRLSTKAAEAWEHRRWLVGVAARSSCGRTPEDGTADAFEALLAHERAAADAAVARRPRCYAAWTHALLVFRASVELRTRAGLPVSDVAPCALGTCIVVNADARAVSGAVTARGCPAAIAAALVARELDATALRVRCVPGDASAWHHRAEVLALLLSRCRKNTSDDASDATGWGPCASAARELSRLVSAEAALVEELRPRCACASQPSAGEGRQFGVSVGPRPSRDVCALAYARRRVAALAAELRGLQANAVV